MDRQDVALSLLAVTVAFIITITDKILLHPVCLGFVRELAKIEAKEGKGRPPSGKRSGGCTARTGTAGTMAREAEEYEMEQEMEIEALEAILMDDLQELTADEREELRLDDAGIVGKCYRVKVEADEDAEENTFPPVLGLVFAHTEKYPDEPPFVHLESLSSLTVGDLEALTVLLKDKTEECLGMSMVYELCTEAKDWMQNKMGMNDVIEDEGAAKRRRELEEEEKRARERAAGTPVTPETFAAWKADFDREMEEKLGKKVDVNEGKLTGRKFFETRDVQEVEESSDEEEDALDTFP